MIPNARDFLGEDVNDQTLNILRGAINYISVLDSAIQQKRKDEKN